MLKINQYDSGKKLSVKIEFQLYAHQVVKILDWEYRYHEKEEIIPAISKLNKMKLEEIIRDNLFNYGYNIFIQDTKHNDTEIINKLYEKVGKLLPDLH